MAKVPEGALAYIARDLREGLEAGWERGAMPSAAGLSWLNRWALISALVGLALFLAGGYHGGFSHLNAAGSRLPAWAWQWLTMLGDERVTIALALFFSRRFPRVFWALILAALLGFAFTHSVKPLAYASRPPAVMDAGTFYLIGPALRSRSFPSGHTVTAAIFFGVWLCYLRASWLRLMMILLAVGVGLSRVALGVHWPIDIAGGLVGGAMAARFGVLISERGGRFGRDPSIHLAAVTVSVVMAISLFLWDRGYSQASSLLQILGAAALAYGASVYLIGPLTRYVAARQGRQ